MSVLASQIYTLAVVLPTSSWWKSKSSKYTKKLYSLRRSFIEEDIYHPCLEVLTSLIYAFNKNIHNMKVYGYDRSKRQSIVSNTNDIDMAIYKAILRCEIFLKRSLQTKNTLDL